MLNLKKTDTVLDIGCGTGRLAIPIAKKVRKVYALDASREMNRLPRLYRCGTHLNRLLSAPVYREFALIPTLTDGEFPLN